MPRRITVDERRARLARRHRLVPEERTDLGMRWLKFHEDHDRARGLSGDKPDPEEYVEENAG